PEPPTAGAVLELLLQVDDAEPAPELVADAAHAPDLLESEALVQRDRGLGALVADDGDQLAQAALLAGLDEGREQGGSEPFAGRGGTQIDRALDRVPERRLARPRRHERVPEDLPRRRLGDEERHVELLQVRELLAPLLQRPGLLVERHDRVRDVVVVDLADMRQIGLAGGADLERERMRALRPQLLAPAPARELLSGTHGSPHPPVDRIRALLLEQRVHAREGAGREEPAARRQRRRMRGFDAGCGSEQRRERPRLRAPEDRNERTLARD